MKGNDLTNRRFGRLKVTEPAGTDAKGNRLWLCRCDCGKETIVLAGNLKAGRTRSCGCLRVETGWRLIKIARIHQARMARRVKQFRKGVYP